ncbi:MAG: hypothetical protein JNL50_01375 [Phycisphaerae bacterium]|nr:hypothetical protein [Phycisphaerae bacterium]
MSKAGCKVAARPGRGSLVGSVVGVLALGALGLAHVAIADVPPVVFPVENPFSEEKRVLGKILFFDEQMSTSNTVACATCHAMPRAGADPRLARHPGDDNILNTPDDIQGSPGVVKSDSINNYEADVVFALNPQITGRTANSPINAAFAPNLFWDGRATSRFVDPETGETAIQNGGALESQSLQPLVNTIEMAHAGTSFANLAERLSRVHPLNLATSLPADVAAALDDKPSYGELFARAFGDESITTTRIAFAIATYERTLISDDSPYDRFRDGQTNALTPAQQRGLQIFQGQPAHCNACHTLVDDLFTGNGFRNIGLRPIAEDNGRQAVTGLAVDAGRFKVPGLRNVGLKRTFMHNGQFQTLTDVLRWYARGQGAPPQFPQNQDPLIPTIQLPPQAAADVQDFLQNGLTDARVANATFPFDRPVLFGERPTDRATVIGGGVPGTGGIVPQIVVDAPAMLGNTEYRIGAGRVLGGATLRLGISLSPPVGGRITPTRWFDVTSAGGAGAGAGVATQHWALVDGEADTGQVLFAQWFVDDPAAAGGQAASSVGRIPVFCGSAGCPSPCGPADINSDGFTNADDYDLFALYFEGGDPRGDVNADGFVNGDDYDFFAGAFEAGC